MEIFKIIAFAVVALLLIVILKETNSQMAIILTIVSTIVIFGFVIIKLDDVVSMLYEIVNGSGLNSDYLKILIKVTGIAYIVELTKNICMDAGSSSLATKVEMAGKASIVVLTIPILTSIIEVITEII